MNIVVPIYRGGNKGDPLNYRPLSLSSVITNPKKNTERQMNLEELNEYFDG